ncbi:hypothetical protein M9458_009268, partial [Cirrhinus mrigala]
NMKLQKPLIDANGEIWRQLKKLGPNSQANSMDSDLISQLPLPEENGSFLCTTSFTEGSDINVIPS